MLGVEMGGVVTNRGVARWRGMVRMRAMIGMRAMIRMRSERTDSRRLLPKIRPKASSSTGQYRRSRRRTPGEWTHLQQTGQVKEEGSLFIKF